MGMRMINWTKLAKSIIETEFPSYGVLCHLSQCTFLDKHKYKNKHKSISLASIASLKALSIAWNIDFVTWLSWWSWSQLSQSFSHWMLWSFTSKVALKAEMKTLYPVAMVIMIKEDVDEVVAWSRAILRERRLCGQGACKAASKIIVRALAWSFSTSDVERLPHVGTDHSCNYKWDKHHFLSSFQTNWGLAPVSGWVATREVLLEKSLSTMSCGLLIWRKLMKRKQLTWRSLNGHLVCKDAHVSCCVFIPTTDCPIIRHGSMEIWERQGRTFHNLNWSFHSLMGFLRCLALSLILCFDSFQANPKLHMRRKAETTGESAWLRKRRRLVSKAVNDETVAASSDLKERNAVSKISRDLWTEKQTKEARLQKQRSFENRL